VARAMALVARALPGGNGAQGNAIKKGRESEGSAPSLVTKLTDRAAVANNEM